MLHNLSHLEPLVQREKLSVTHTWNVWNRGGLPGIRFAGCDAFSIIFCRMASSRIDGVSSSQDEAGALHRGYSKDLGPSESLCPPGCSFPEQDIERDEQWRVIEESIRRRNCVLWISFDPSQQHRTSLMLSSQARLNDIMVPEDACAISVASSKACFTDIIVVLLDDRYSHRFDETIAVDFVNRDAYWEGIHDRFRNTCWIIWSSF